MSKQIKVANTFGAALPQYIPLYSTHHDIPLVFGTILCARTAYKSKKDTIKYYIVVDSVESFEISKCLFLQPCNADGQPKNGRVLKCSETWVRSELRHTAWKIHRSIYLP